jgi:hypothetical protein
MNYLSKWARRIALVIFLISAVGAIAATELRIGAGEWLLDAQGALGFQSRKLTVAILLLVGMLLGIGLGFVHDRITRKGVFRPPGERIYVEIIGVPKGDAPEWVRQAWVGTLLPLMPGREEPQEVATSGVVSRKITSTGDMPYWVDGKYAVLTDEAIAILQRQAPQAAAWWRTNVPHLLGKGRALAFETAVCRKIDVPNPPEAEPPSA